MIKFLEKIFGGFVGAFEFPKPEVQREYTPRDALLLALDDIENDRQMFICISLQSLIATSSNSLKVSATIALKRIKHLMNVDDDSLMNVAITHWLWANHHDFYVSHIQSGEVTGKQYRIEWIKHMLENDPVFSEST